MNGCKTAKRRPTLLASILQASVAFIFDFVKRAVAGIETETPAATGISKIIRERALSPQGTSKTFWVVGSSAREPLSSPVMSSSL